MKVIVCGGRQYSDARFLYRTLDAIHDETPITLLIEGGALGADWLGSMWAQSRKVPVKRVEAEWNNPIYRKSAGRRRNHKMLKLKPDLVVAFQGGGGTAHMCEIAETAGVKVNRTWQQ